MNKNQTRQRVARAIQVQIEEARQVDLDMYRAGADSEKRIKAT